MPGQTCSFGDEPEKTRRQAFGELYLCPNIGVKVGVPPRGVKHFLQTSARVNGVLDYFLGTVWRRPGIPASTPCQNVLGFRWMGSPAESVSKS